MATKKEEVTHESLMADIKSCEEALSAAKLKYKEFCQANPLELPKQPTLHELRLMREKNDKPTVEDHKKSNARTAAQAAKAGDKWSHNKR